MNILTKSRLNTLRGHHLAYAIKVMSKDSMITKQDMRVVYSSGLGEALEQRRIRKQRARDLNKMRRASRKRNRAA